MPEVAAWVSSLRDAFGDAVIEEAIRQSKAGEPTFFASENGRTVGIPAPTSTNTWVVDRAVADRHFCAGCDGSCVGTGQRCPAR
ncbi:hypothetical protein [Burkholderia cenocepacia]|uniref:hypothetical protein n=1 Tax=Burkholderia cenocepacia TaxID=95486 RepID=UPI002866B891|nr:hypothetical protein [Burkholderia cenocepacia]MDR5646767.1 hypothetical protein [Burkholderia cenocepacia]